MEQGRILIVDDTPANIEILTDLLAPEYRINVALNGFDAIDLIKSSFVPDLVLLDIMMPNLDGYRSAAFLRQEKTPAGYRSSFSRLCHPFKMKKKGWNWGLWIT